MPGPHKPKARTSLSQNSQVDKAGFDTSDVYEILCERFFRIWLMLRSTHSILQGDAQIIELLRMRGGRDTAVGTANLVKLGFNKFNDQ